MPRIVPLLGKLFNIRRDEWPRFLLIYILYFITLTGIQWGRPTVEAAFVTAVGVKFLPWVFVVNALVTIGASAIYTAFADRVDNTKLLIALFVASMVGISLGLLLLNWSLVAIIYPLILLFLVLNVPLLDIFNVHWPIYINSFYNTQSAKRIIPLLASGARFAGIVAGLTLPYLNSFFESSTTVIFIWFLTLIVSVSIAWLMPYLLKEKEAVSDQQTFTPWVAAGTQRSPSYLDNIKEGFHYVQQSVFLRWLAVAALLTFTLLPLINFQALQILEGQYRDEQDIANFIANLNVIGNLIALPIQLFILNRLIGRIGLGNTSLIFPVGTLAVSVTLFFQRLIPVQAAALGYLNGTVFRTTFRNPVDNLWYNAIPLRVKGRARAFIVGLVVPIGGLIGGSLLLLPNLSQSWLLALIGLLGLAFVAVALVARQQYAHALITMLEQEDFSFLFSQEDLSLSAADPATLNSLKQKLSQSSSPELTIFIAQLISHTGGGAAASVLGQAVREAKVGQIRAAILDVITAAGLGGRLIRELYMDCLADTDGQVRQAAVVGLERLAGLDDDRFLSLLLSMLYDPDINVRVRVLSALARSGNFYKLSEAVESLNQFLADQEPERRAHAMRILGEVGDLRAIRNLTDYLTDPGDAARLAATVALEPLLTAKLPDSLNIMVVERAGRLLRDPIERVRQAALNILGHLGDHHAYQVMVESLTDPSSQVRATAVDALVNVGKRVIPIFHPQLDSPDPQQRKMATVILSRVNQREYGGLINAHITNNLLTIYHNYGRMEALRPCLDFSGIKVLRSALREQNEALLAEIFYLLTAIHDPEDVKIVTDSLESRSPRVRANAAEALESLTTPQTAQLISPLFEPELEQNHLLQISQEIWDIKHADAAETIQYLVVAPSQPWLRAISLFALGEMGARLSAAERQANGEQPIQSVGEAAPGSLEEVSDETASTSSQKPEQSKPRRARRVRPADLLGALTDTTAAAEDPVADNEPQQRRSRRSRPADLLDVLAGESQEEEPISPPAEKTNEAETPTDLTFIPFDLPEIDKMLNKAFKDPKIEVRLAARAAKRMLAGFNVTNIPKEEVVLLSTIEKIIFLKEVPFFQSMTIHQLEVLANICEEQLFAEDERIFDAGEPGGALYVIVSGKVGIEQERRKGQYARLATLEPRSYFGETSLFDDTPRAAAAIALQDTITLRVRREPLIALARQYPDLSLELISVLSQRLRQANDRIAELTRSRPRQLQKLFDKFD